MGQDSFRDHYEDLQISPNADLEMIERVFRLLAKRYHPDNKQTGDADKFNILYEAYSVLSDPKKRASYDAKYEHVRASRWKIFEEASQSDGFESDDRIRQGVLSLLYVARRQDALNPGMGVMELERLLGCPQHHMEFHIWYLKEKGWSQRTDSGEHAITASGVDKVAENELMLRKDRLLTEPGEFSTESGESKNLAPDKEPLLSHDFGQVSSQ
jgi:curved DNA-binding protein CbpA